MTEFSFGNLDGIYFDVISKSDGNGYVLSVDSMDFEYTDIVAPQFINLDSGDPYLTSPFKTDEKAYMRHINSKGSLFTETEYDDMDGNGVDEFVRSWFEFDSNTSTYRLTRLIIEEEISQETEQVISETYNIYPRELGTMMKEMSIILNEDGNYALSQIIKTGATDKRGLVISPIEIVLQNGEYRVGNFLDIDIYNDLGESILNTKLAEGPMFNSLNTSLYSDAQRDYISKRESRSLSQLVIENIDNASGMVFIPEISKSLPHYNEFIYLKNFALKEDKQINSLNDIPNGN